nr:hypothetical protein [Evansella caseinilytica]
MRHPRSYERSRCIFSKADPKEVFFSYRTCSDEQSYDAFPIELSRRIVILSCACRGRDKHGAIALK